MEFHKFDNKIRPFDGYCYLLKTDNLQIYLDPDEFKQVDTFPKKIPEPVFGTIHKDRIDIPYRSFGFYSDKIGKSRYLFGLKNKYKFLKKGDVVVIPSDEDMGSSYSQGDNFIQATQLYTTTVKKFLDTKGKYYEDTIKTQNPGIEFKGSDPMTVFEIRPVYKWMFEDKLAK